MIKSVTVTNYVGDTAKIVLAQDNPTHGFLIKSIDGLGPAKANINTTNFATNDGSYYNSARLEQRNIVIELLFGGIPSIEEARQNTYKYFPIKKNLELLIETDNRLLKTTGYVESNEPQIFDKQEGCQISIVCPNSYFQSGHGKQENSFFGITPVFEFPFFCDYITYETGNVQDSNGNEVLDGNDENVIGTIIRVGEDYVIFGDIENTALHNIKYLGDAQTGLEITIHITGTVSGVITIINNTANEIMQLSIAKIEELLETELQAGDDIVITTEIGNKTIRFMRDGRYYNILGCLGYGSDWFQLSKGDNIFVYSVTEGFENLQFKFENQVIFEGV